MCLLHDLSESPPQLSSSYVPETRRAWIASVSVAYLAKSPPIARYRWWGAISHHSLFRYPIHSFAEHAVSRRLGDVAFYLEEDVSAMREDRLKAS